MLSLPNLISSQVSSGLACFTSGALAKPLSWNQARIEPAWGPIHKAICPLWIWEISHTSWMLTKKTISGLGMMLIPQRKHKDSQDTLTNRQGQSQSTICSFWSFLKGIIYSFSPFRKNSRNNHVSLQKHSALIACTQRPINKDKNIFAILCI